MTAIRNIQLPEHRSLAQSPGTRRAVLPCPKETVMNARTRFLVARLFAILTVLVIGGPPGVAEARITKIQITTTESPTFGGYSWPGVGQYEKIVGTAFGEVNPADPRNSVIVDIELAPRNASGNVEYSFDFYILKPINLGNGAHKVMYEPPNRGGKTWASLGRFPAGGNDPGSVTDPAVLANAFLMPRGYTMVWSGWDKSAGNNGANFNLRIGGPLGPGTSLAIAKNPGDTTITGPAYEYIVTGPATTSFALSYPAATADKTPPNAMLTHRVHLNGTPQSIDPSGWEYTNSSRTAIRLLPAGTSFVAND